jgi:modulator of FtsH protease
MLATDAYHAAAWTSFFQAVVAAAAALVGLLFVAVSLNVAFIADSPKHRARAREALGQLLVLVILGIVVLLPGQSRSALGAELVVYGTAVAAVTIGLQSSTVRRLAPDERARWIVRVMGYDVGVATITIAGAGLLARGAGGLYWLVPTVLIFFVWSSLNAWFLLIGARGG